MRLYAENLAVVPLRDLWRPLSVTLGITLVLWLLAGAVLRDYRRGAAVASTAIALLFVYDLLSAKIPPFATYLVYAVLLVVCGWKFRRGPTQFFNLTGTVLAVMVVLRIGFGVNRVQQSLALNVEGTQAASKVLSGPRPDIFYIILDGYGRSDAVKYFTGYDNSEFINGLRQRGFFIADKGHSNYTQTEQSLSSSLNMDFLHDLFDYRTPQEVVRSKFDSLIDKNRVAAVLRSKGYRYVAVTTGFQAVNPKSADVLYENNSSLSLFETALLNATPFAENPYISGSQFDSKRIRLLNAFNNLSSLAAPGTLPRFVFVHILAPHPPFVFNADGSPHKKEGGPYGLWDGDAYMRVGGTLNGYREGYAGQAAYAGKRTLEGVDAILRSQKVPPIIIVQGDHGSKSKLSDTSLAKTDVREVFRNLNAYYVPPEVKSRLYPEITPVNSFRIILSTLYGESFPKLPDTSFYSTWEEPGRFTEVSSKDIEAPLAP